METDIQKACRDRWENIKSIVSDGMADDYKTYINQLLTELAGYSQAGIMPNDIEAEWKPWKQFAFKLLKEHHGC